MTEEDFKISVSKAKTFQQCAKQYEFSYILKFPKKIHSYHTTGKLIHRALEVFHLAYMNGCHDPYHITMSRAWREAYAEHKENCTPEMKKECWDIVNNYLKMVSTQKRSNITGMPGNVVGVEKTFELQLIDNIIVRGGIDRLQIDDDNVLHVCDYKSSKSTKYLKNDWFQLLTYSYVVLTANPDIKKVRGSYIMLKHDFQYITKEFGIDEIMSVKEKLIGIANQMQTEKEFAPTTSALCNFCDFQDFCPEGKSKAYNKPVFGEVGY